MSEFKLKQLQNIYAQANPTERTIQIAFDLGYDYAVNGPSQFNHHQAIFNIYEYERAWDKGRMYELHTYEERSVNS